MRTERGWGDRGVWAALALAVLTASPVVGQRQAPEPPTLPSPPAAPRVTGGPEKVITGDYVVQRGEVVEEVVVVGGDLRVLGEVTGDVVVVGGDLVLEESGIVRGDAMITGGELHEAGGRVLGEMRVVDGDERDHAEIRAAMEAAEDEDEAHDGGRHTVSRTFHVHRERSWFDPIGRGFAGLVRTLALGLVLGGIGSLLIFYGRPYLDTVSDTLRSSTLRSAGVGLAAGFLVIPAFVILVVALAVTIIGIPLLLVAVPLYPLVVAGAVAFGLLAAAHAIGERTAEQRREAYDLRYRNAYAYLFTGLGMLLTPLLAADLIGMTGFLGFIGVLLKVVTWLAIWAAATAGFGAVILSRAGRDRSFAHGMPAQPPFDPDALFDDDPGAGVPHV